MLSWIIKSKQAPHTTLTLFYGKFRACVPRIRHLIVEVERRQDQAPEYKALLQVGNIDIYRGVGG